MAKIAISELRPAGADLFDGSESFLQELTDAELSGAKGGFLWLRVAAVAFATRYLYAKYGE